MRRLSPDDDYETICTCLEQALRDGRRFECSWSTRYHVKLHRLGYSEAEAFRASHHEWTEAVATVLNEANDASEEQAAFEYDDRDHRADTRLGLFLSREEMRGRR